jgi:hypothetical protein
MRPILLATLMASFVGADHGYSTLILRQVEEQGVGVALAGASGPGALEDGVE